MGRKVLSGAYERRNVHEVGGECLVISYGASLLDAFIEVLDEAVTTNEGEVPVASMDCMLLNGSLVIGILKSSGSKNNDFDASLSLPGRFVVPCELHVPTTSFKYSSPSSSKSKEKRIEAAGRRAFCICLMIKITPWGL